MARLQAPRITRRERLLLSLGLVVVVGVLFYFFVHEPLEQNIAELAETVEAQAAMVARAEAVAARDSRTQARLAEVRTQLELADRLVPPTLDEPGLLVYLQQAARAAGVEILWLTVAAAEGEGGILRHPATASVAGTYTQQATFLRRLESLSRLVHISRIYLEPVTEILEETEGDGGSRREADTGYKTVLPLQEGAGVVGADDYADNPRVVLGEYYFYLYTDIELGGTTPSLADFAGEVGRPDPFVGDARGEQPYRDGGEPR